MGTKGGFILFGLLLILCVLCHSGHSLQCYNCLNQSGRCTSVTNCSANFDSCIHIQTEKRTYNQCWKFGNCNYLFISNFLGEKKLEYQCCQKDLCNKSGPSVTGTTVVLVTQLLAVFWKLLI